MTRPTRSGTTARMMPILPAAETAAGAILGGDIDTFEVVGVRGSCAPDIFGVYRPSSICVDETRESVEMLDQEGFIDDITLVLRDGLDVEEMRDQAVSDAHGRLREYCDID